MRSLPCWCTHQPESHAKGRSDKPRCVRCEREVSHYFDPAHRYQPIGTLPPHRMLG